MGIVQEPQAYSCLTAQEKVAFLKHQIIRPGQRVCRVDPENKVAWPIARLFDPNDPCWDTVLTAHVANGPITVDIAFKGESKDGEPIDRPPVQAKSFEHFMLGAYYGGTQTAIKDGLNYASSFAIDVDQAKEDHLRLKATEKQDKPRHAEIKQEIKDNWDKRRPVLRKMLEKVQAEFPGAAIFLKDNGKFHAHGNLTEPRPAVAVNRWIRHKLGEMFTTDEGSKAGTDVFPACTSEPKEERYRDGSAMPFVGNQVRLPFSPLVQYHPIEPLRPIAPVDASEIDAFMARNPLEQQEKPIDCFLLEREFEQEAYMGCSRQERRSRYGRYLDRYPEAIDGAGGSNTTIKACAQRFGFGVPKADAWDVLREWNKRLAPPWSEKELRHKLDDAAMEGHFAGKEPGWHLAERNDTASQAPKRAEDPPFAPPYVPPTKDELGMAIAGTPLCDFCREYRKLDEDRRIPWEFVLLDGIVAGCAALCERRVRVGLAPDDPMPIWPNAYAMKLAPSGTGKGVTSRMLVNIVAPAMGVQRLRGDSHAALVGYCQKGAARGLCYKSELKKLMSRDNAVATQIVTTFLEAFDEGEMAHVIRPGGSLMEAVVRECYPSLLVDGQPDTLEACCEKSLVDAGLLARFLIAMPTVKKGARKSGSPNCQVLLDAYRDMLAMSEKVVVRDPRRIEGRASRHVSETENDGGTAGGAIRPETGPAAGQGMAADRQVVYRGAGEGHGRGGMVPCSFDQGDGAHP